MGGVPDSASTQDTDDAAASTALRPVDAPVVEQPAKLLRIAMMVRELLEEVRRAPIDEAGRKQLSGIYERVISELKTGVSDVLAEELERLTIPLSQGAPSESEIRIAQAQLLGWLEGIFQGIQAAIATQQMQAAAQLDEIRRRGLQAPRAESHPEPTGPYL